MPHGAKVIAEAHESKRQHDRVLADDRLRTGGIVRNSESAMDPYLRAAATRKFYGSIRPYCADRFWSYAEANGAAVRAQGVIVRDEPSPPAPAEISVHHADGNHMPLGNNENLCIEAIFLEIKRMILDKIIADRATDSVIRNWIATNKEILLNPQHAQHANVMEQSRTASVTLSNGTRIRGYLASLQSVEQAAWRNFDILAPLSGFTNLMVGPRATPEVTRRIAYSYLIATDFAYRTENNRDPGRAPLPISVSAADAMHIEANFIGQLADIRRAHNEGAGGALQLDNTSCFPGTIGRMGKMGDRHPQAALAVNIIEFISLPFTAIMKRALTRGFSHCSDLQAKQALRDALLYFKPGQIIDDTQEYSDELLDIRANFITSLGTEQQVIAEINTALLAGGESALIPALEARVRYMMRDCAFSVQGENIIDSFNRSLTREESMRVYPPHDYFYGAMGEERNRVAGLLPDRTVYSVAAMRQRVIQALVDSQKWGNLTFAELNERIIPEEEEARISTYETAEAMLPPNARGLSPTQRHRLVITRMIPNGERITDPSILNPLIQEMEQLVTAARDNCLLREYGRARDNTGTLTGDVMAQRPLVIRELIRLRNEARAIDGEDALTAAEVAALTQEIETAMRRGDPSIIARITAALTPVRIPSPVTNANLNDLLDTFKDNTTQETIEHLVYFPPLSNRNGPQFLERATAQRLFNETRAKKLMHDRLATMTYEQVCAALRNEEAFRNSIDSIVSGVLGEGGINSVMDLLGGTGADALEFMRQTGSSVNADFQITLEALRDQFGEEAGNKRCAIYTVIIGEAQKLVNPTGIYEAGVGGNPPVIRARNPANRVLLVESEMRSGELFQKVALVAAKAAVDAHPANFTDEQHAELDKAFLITSKAIIEANPQVFGGADDFLEELTEALDDFDNQTAQARNALIQVITAHQLIADPQVENALNRLYSGEAVFDGPLMQTLRRWGIGGRLERPAAPAVVTRPPIAPVVTQPLVAPPRAAGVGIAIPVGYNQAINEAQVLAAGVAAPLIYSMPGPIQQLRPGEHHRLLSANIGIAGPYQTSINIPQVPVIHPYNPLGNAQANAARNGGIPCFSLSARLPGGTLSNLPPGTAEYLVQNNINLQHVETFVSFQNRPWQNDPLEFRPHPWLHRTAPENGQHNSTSNLSVAFAGLNTRLSPLTNEQAITHGEGGEVVFSPNNMQIAGLGDHNTSEAFYSLCINRDTGRVAVTFHCLLNDNDQRVLDRIVARGAGGALLAGIQAQMVGELPPAITDGLHQFMYGRDPAAAVQAVSRYSLAEAQALRVSGGDIAQLIAIIESSAVDKVAQLRTLLGGGGVAVNGRDGFNRTPLHMASFLTVTQSAALVALLLDNGANPALTEANGWTPVQYAIQQNNQAALDVYIARRLVNQADMVFAQRHQPSMVPCIEVGCSTRNRTRL
jgi:hypothetical protein